MSRKEAVTKEDGCIRLPWLKELMRFRALEDKTREAHLVAHTYSSLKVIVMILTVQYVVRLAVNSDPLCLLFWRSTIMLFKICVVIG